VDHHRRQGAVLTVTIRTVAETGSTNADMLQLARSGVGEGLWLRAERQLGGRGRQGRAWVSPVGNFYGSTLVRVRASDPPPATLALVAAVALDEVVRAYLGLSGADEALLIKWPNDLLIAGAKLSGILLERADDAVVVGIGVNLAHYPDDTDRAATSLAARGAGVDPADFAQTLAESYARWLGLWRGQGLAPVRARWIERAHRPGTALTARLADGTAVDGLFDGLGEDGALILRLADCAARVIHAGDVFLL
jgi:BirA family biotin operon repressor/biotin-[acetyl-CoA-carboxylase] ligase